LHGLSGARVLRGDIRAPDELRGAAIALGVMDGVHLGHQAVLAEAQAAARAKRAPLAAAVFEPPPRRHFQPTAPPFRVQNARQRARALAEAGAEAVFEIPFDATLATTSEEAFARRVLGEVLGAAHVAVGFDFRFGRGRAGDAQALRAYGETCGFSVGIVPAVTSAGEKVSSTAIRTAIGAGLVEEAGAMLSRPWAVEAVVVAGDRRGRTIGFPTANMKLDDYVRPRFGIYAVRASFGGATFDGVASCGLRPMFAVDEPLLEAHLFDFDGDLYGQTIEVSFIRFLRLEQNFDSLDALKTQIADDARRAREILASSD
jgi:riboflavin kinase/FMN adenylyltransferase